MMPSSSHDSNHALTDSLSSRQAFIDSLSAVITRSKADVESILSKLQWSEEKVLEGPGMVRCRVNSHHMVQESSLLRHTEQCQLVKDGYSRQEQTEIPDNAWFYANAKNVFSLSLDQSTQNQILSKVPGSGGIKPVPKTMDRIESDMSSQEKLAVYEHVVQKAKEAGQETSVALEELAFDPNASIQKEKRDIESRAALLAKQRDLKRRRQTYRAKNVHITRRSQTEIMKELIDSQMSELEDICKEEQRRKRREVRRKEVGDNRDGGKNGSDRRRLYRDDRRDEKRQRRHDSGNEDSYDRIRVKVEHEEGEVVEVDAPHPRRRSRYSSKDRSPEEESGISSRHASRDRSPREGSRHASRDKSPGEGSRHASRDRSPEEGSRRGRREREQSQNRLDEGHNGAGVVEDRSAHVSSLEESVESVAGDRSHEGSVDSAIKDREDERKHRKKKKKHDRGHRSQHKHKHSHDRVRVKEEQF